jgi:hypothetical protein
VRTLPKVLELAKSSLPGRLKRSTSAVLGCWSFCITGISRIASKMRLVLSRNSIFDGPLFSGPTLAKPDSESIVCA